MSNSGVYEDEIESLPDNESQSDNESLYIDSPSDGYFAPRYHPQETFVENSSIRAESDDKAREAAQERSREVETSTASRTSPRASLRSPVWATESTPLLDAGPAPPDYAAATAGRRTDQNVASSGRSQSSVADVVLSIADRLSGLSGEREPREVLQHTPQPPRRRSARHPSRSTPVSRTSYGSIDSGEIDLGDAADPADSPHPSYEEREWPFGERHNPFGSGFPFINGNNAFGQNFPFRNNYAPFNFMRQPQQMGDQLPATAQEEQRHGDQTPLPRWRNDTKKPRRRFLRRCCRPFVTISVLLAITLLFMALLMYHLANNSSEVHVPEDHGDDGSHGNDGSTPKEPVPWPSPTVPAGPEISHQRDSACPLRYYSEAGYGTIHSQTSFSFLEDLSSAAYAVRGTVWLAPAAAEQKVPLRVGWSFAASEDLDTMGLRTRLSRDRLELLGPEPGHARSKVSCLSVAVSLSIKDDTVLEYLNLSTTAADIRAVASSSEFMRAAETWNISSTHIETRSGNIRLPYWNSRETVIKSHSGSVSGDYDLRDLLAISSWSGSVSISVHPDAADEERPRPANLRVDSHSGSVKVNTNIVEPPDRDYRTKILTDSASISGTYLFSTSASFKSSSGSITADLLPLISDYTSAALYTEGGSSSTNLHLLSPLRASNALSYMLDSSHVSGSGSLHIEYPNEWEGTIEGKTGSGSINLVGEDLKVHYATDHQILARKGKGASEFRFRTGSGSANLRFGRKTGGASGVDRDGKEQSGCSWMDWVWWRC